MQSYRGQRVLDLSLVILSAPVWLPLLGLVAVAVRLRLGSPVLFFQERTGYGGRSFRMRKFRTMRDAAGPDGRPRPDAERLTPFGRKLRATSLDELPELFNILSGHMALVGPRPLLPVYLDRYSAKHKRRHEVRPGLTGLAQVRGRNNLGWAEKFDLDVEYVDRASLWLDLQILAGTIAAVFGRRGISAPGDATAPEFTGYLDSAPQ